MTASDVEIEKCNYKMEVPEGGWGNVIVVAMSLMFLATVGPFVAFGIIFGEYLATIDDEASATAILNCLFNTITNFMGLFGNHLLKNRSCRYVGILGSIIYFTGCFATTFANSLVYLILTFGIMQGVGFGLMVTATLVSFNQYFLVRRNLMMGISQTTFSAASMVIPYLIKIIKDEYGYRGTLAIISAISLNSFLAMSTLQPVEWHMKKVPVFAAEMAFLPEEKDKLKEDYIQNNPEKDNYFLEPSDENKKPITNKIWAALSDFLELSLLKDLSFVNMAVGCSLGFMSDIMFLAMLPMFLNHMEYSPDEIAYLMTAYMIADLIGRLSLSLLSAVIKFESKILFWWGCVVMTVIRIVFTYSEEWLWILILVTMLGLLRCLIQITIPLVLAEYSQEKFSAVFGLYLTICGIVSLATGQFSSIVSNHTTGDVWVQHFYTLHMVLCVVFWSIEMIYNRIKK